MNKEFLDSFSNHYASDAYNFLGSFWDEEKTVFRVYAPHAKYVSVIGDFNYWNPDEYPCYYISNGIWEGIIKGIKIYDNYKYHIVSKNGRVMDKQDPYAHHSETDSQTASKVYPMGGYNWTDNKWMNERGSKDLYRSPINIYEVHLGSWMKTQNNEVLNYRDIAYKLVDYVKMMGYNYIEVLPIMEHPLLASWGYQVTGFFSVTSRYGVPNDFKFFVEHCHKNGIGVILDWVPAHFCKNDYALIEYDGEYLYEDPAPTRRENAGWGTRCFNYAKPEIKSFLISSACYYFEEFHVDGLRVDAVASMLYLDFGRSEWVPNKDGGNINYEAVEFFHDLNTTVFNKFGNIMMIAEESTAFPRITKPVNMGGLGFNFKWNMGWMNDTLKYIETDPYFRGDHHYNMTFSMSYAFSENYVLAISHDEVVHLKKSLLQKMPGYYDDKFGNLKTYLGFMMTHSGKKLLFMGQEIGSFDEWNENIGINWFLLDYPKHKMLQKFCSDLNNFYLKNSELYEIEDSWDGFEWISADNKESSTFVFKRRNRKGKELLVFINLSGLYYDNFRIFSNKESLNGNYKVVFNSDSNLYGGENKYNYDGVTFKAKDGTLDLPINKLSFLILKK